MQKFEKPLNSHILYQATYKAHIASIMQWDLGGAPEMPAANYEDSKKGMVYLATTSDIAVSYAETSDFVPAALSMETPDVSIDEENPRC